MDFNQASAYIVALTGEPAETACLWWRCIHDTNKEVPAHKYYGTLYQLWNTLCDYNNRGYGIFVNINIFDANANTHNIPDVKAIRTHVIDLDDVINSNQNFQIACAAYPNPAFAVNTSTNKFHIYWPTIPYVGSERYSVIQRKLRQLYNGDAHVIDPTRVLRVPGFYHMKNPSNPHIVQFWALSGYGQKVTPELMEAVLAHVNVINGFGGRHELGDKSLSAPSIDWLRFGMSLIDPNELDRGEWISVSAAFKQAGWLHTDENTLFSIWSEWCARYANNDLGENRKQWDSIRDTEVGWNSLKRRAPTLNAYERFGFNGNAPSPIQTPPPSQPEPAPNPPQQQNETFPDILSEYDQQKYFKNCFWIDNMGKILTPGGRFMNSTQFNGKYGGKLFIITPDGKTTDEPWKAATRSTLWTIPKVDHIRFLPDKPSFSIVEDQLGRTGVNTYIPIRLKQKPGDITPFLKHMELMLPVETDRQEIYRYLAHNVKFPGYKIPWAPMIQSTEGVGKSFIQEAIEFMLGEMYTYSPKAEELVNSGSTFNAWMRGKLMIVVNEIKVDERRELIEILKPMISDKRVEIQSKGIDQEMEDNPANWFFFSNYKDAIPVTKNGRRYAIFYSCIQSADDLMKRGMNDDYFRFLFNWLHDGGSEIINYWLLNYPVERGGVPMRAPDTSSRDEAIRVSRGPVEVAILHAIEDGQPGFKGGYISTLAVTNYLRQIGVRVPSLQAIASILKAMGYHDIGRASRQYGQESMRERSQLFGLENNLSVSEFGRAQGYE